MYVWHNKRSQLLFRPEFHSHLLFQTVILKEFWRTLVNGQLSYFPVAKKRWLQDSLRILIRSLVREAADFAWYKAVADMISHCNKIEQRHMISFFSLYLSTSVLGCFNFLVIFVLNALLILRSDFRNTFLITNTQIQGIIFCRFFWKSRIISQLYFQLTWI